MTKVETQAQQVDEPGQAPVLDLDALTTRETIVFGGAEYGLRSLERDFGLEEEHRLKNEGQEFLKLWESEKLSQAKYRRMTELLDRIFNVVLDAPDDVKAKITPGQRHEVFMAFMLAPLRRAARKQDKEEKEEDQKARESSTTES